MSQFFSSGGQSIGVSVSVLVLPNEYPGLISFRMDWLDFLAIQGTLKSFEEFSPTPQFKSINSWVLSFLYSPTLTSIGEGNSNLLQYSCLENPMDGGAWWAASPWSHD